MMEYPKHKWVNHGTGTIEFTMMIQHSNLAHLDWKITPRFESANLSITELHAQLNHMPFSAIQQLIQCDDSSIFSSFFPPFWLYLGNSADSP